MYYIYTTIKKNKEEIYLINGIDILYSKKDLEKNLPLDLTTLFGKKITIVLSELPKYLDPQYKKNLAVRILNQEESTLLKKSECLALARV